MVLSVITIVWGVFYIFMWTAKQEVKAPVCLDFSLNHEEFTFIEVGERITGEV